MRKTIITIAAALLLLAFLTACSANNDVLPLPSPEATPQPTATPGPDALPQETGGPGNNGGAGPDSGVTGDFADVYEAIAGNFELVVQSQLTAEQISELYGLSEGDYDKALVMMPLINVKASELAIFEGEDAKKIKNGINKRQEDLEKQWSSYLPDQYELVKNSVIKQDGRYIVYVIDEKAEEIADALIEELKK